MLRLARLHFLIPGFLLYAMGCLLAISNGASFDTIKFLFGYMIFGCAHVSVSFSNDYFDRKTDAQSVRTAFSGGSRVLVEHPQLENVALTLALFFLATSTIGAALFTFVFAYSYWFLAFAVLGGLLGWFYTAPPLKLAYRKLGELSAVLAVGLIMPGMGYFVSYGSIDSLFAVFVFPLSCYGFLFILTVEMPDIDSDRAAKKTNVLVKLGLRTGMRLSLFSAMAGTLFLVAINLLGILAGKVDLWFAAIFSLMPVVGVTSGLFADLNRRECLTRQITINMIAIILFLFLLDLYLLRQVIA